MCDSPIDQYQTAHSPMFMRRATRLACFCSASGLLRGCFVFRKRAFRISPIDFCCPKEPKPTQTVYNHFFSLSVSSVFFPPPSLAPGSLDQHVLSVRGKIGRRRSNSFIFLCCFVCDGVLVCVIDCVKYSSAKAVVGSRFCVPLQKRNKPHLFHGLVLITVLCVFVGCFFFFDLI